MSKVTVKRTGLDRLINEVEPTMTKVRDEALDDTAEEMRGTVKVVTGQTRDSITHDGDTITVGFGGLFLELGSRYMAPQPFMVPALVKIMDHVYEKTGEHLRRVMEA